MREPALLMAAIRAVVVLAVAFGLKLTLEQTAAIYGVIEVITTVITRQTVTPTAAPVLPSNTEVAVTSQVSGKVVGTKVL